MNIIDRNGIAIITPEGRIDSSNAHELRRALGSILDANNTNLVIDLHNVDYISSAGLREIVSAFKRARQQGGDVRLCSANLRVREVFELAGLNSIMELFESQDEALSSY